jgi:hypothetical protein
VRSLDAQLVRSMLLSRQQLLQARRSIENQMRGALKTLGAMADGISKHIGQPVVVENIGGAGGARGSAHVKNARPDGYTIGLGSMGTHAAAVQLNPKLPFDPRTDFDYLGLVSLTPSVLFVRKGFSGDHAQGVHRVRQGQGQGPQARAFGHRLASPHHDLAPVATDRGRADDGRVPGLRSDDP